MMNINVLAPLMEGWVLRRRRALSLSVYTAVGDRCSNISSFSICRRWMTSCTATFRAMYSASVVWSATVLCTWLLHEITLPQ